MSELDKLNWRQFTIFFLYPMSIWYVEVFVLSKIKKQTSKLKPNLEYKNEKVVTKKVRQQKIVLTSKIPMEMISIAFQKAKSQINILSHSKGIKCGYSLEPFFEKDISGSP